VRASRSSERPRASTASSAPARPSDDAIAPTVAGVSADHGHAHALLVEVAKRLGGIRPDAIGQHHERDRRAPVGQCVTRQRRHTCQEDHTRAGVGMPDDLAQRVRVVGQYVRCAEDPGPEIAERGGAPFPRRGERDGVLDRPPGGRRREPVADRAKRCVRGRVGSGERGEHRTGVDPVVQPLDTFERQLALGQGAGLVDAQHIDPREAFHRRQLLHEHPSTREPDDRDGEGDRGQQDEPFGHHRDRACDGARQRRTPGAERAVLADEQERRRRHDRPRHVLQDPVDAAAELRTRERESAGVLGDPRGVGVCAERADLRTSGAGDDERAAQRAVARRLDDRLGLTGQQRLVDLEPVADQHLTVDDHLVAGFQVEHVVSHDRRRRDARGLAVPDDRRGRRRQERQPVKRALGAKLLDDPDERVRNEYHAEQRVLKRPDDQDQHEHRAEQCVEPGEYVRANDLLDGPGVRRRHPVDVAAFDTRSDVGRAQPARRVHRRAPSRVHVQSLRCLPCTLGSWRSSSPCDLCGPRRRADRQRPSRHGEGAGAARAEPHAAVQGPPARSHGATRTQGRARDRRLIAGRPAAGVPAGARAARRRGGAAFVLRYLVKRAGVEVVRTHWRGEPATLATVLRAARIG
jgi:hypothetical protein